WLSIDSVIVRASPFEDRWSRILEPVVVDRAHLERMRPSVDGGVRQGTRARGEACRIETTLEPRYRSIVRPGEPKGDGLGRGDSAVCDRSAAPVNGRGDHSFWRSVDRPYAARWGRVHVVRSVDGPDFEGVAADRKTVARPRTRARAEASAIELTLESRHRTI